MKSRILICIAMLLCVGCATAKFPICNEKLDQSAKLVQIANDHNICLEVVGKELILANGMAISVAKLYTAQEALIAVDKLIVLLENPISDIFFRTAVNDMISDFPELMIATDIFQAEFGTGQIIDNVSRKMMSEYLKNQIKPMIEIRIKNSNGE